MRSPPLSLLAAAALAACVAPLARAFTITPSFVSDSAQTWTTAEEAVVNEAIGDWTSILSYSDPNQNINITFQFQSAGLTVGPSSGYLALWTGSYSTTQGSAVYPWSTSMTHIVYVNTDWMTPPAGDPVLTFATGTPGPGLTTISSSSYDALTAIRHELGHALGLSSLYTTDALPSPQVSPSILQSYVTDAGSTGAIFDDTPGGLNIPLASATNIEHYADNNDLMSTTLNPGVRKGIGFTDIEELSLAYGYAVTIPAGLSYPTTTFKTQTITLNGAVHVSATTGTRNTPAVILSSANLTINSGGLLDLSNHDLIINAGQSLASVRSLIASGQGNGSWNGTTGITSSTAAADGATFGFATAGALNVSTFDGLAVNPTAILLKYTYLGDTNLDGTVDLNDLNTVLNNLGTTTSAWSSGNFDGAATIDLNDLNDVLNHLGLTIPSTSTATLADASVAGSAVPASAPEPATLALLGVIFPLFLRKRRPA